MWNRGDSFALRFDQCCCDSIGGETMKLSRAPSPPLFRHSRQNKMARRCPCHTARECKLYPAQCNCMSGYSLLYIDGKADYSLTMKPSFRSLLARAITRKLRKFPKPSEAVPPVGGWLRAIRLATGMPASYPAAKLNLTRQSFADLEKNEALGAITLKSLRRAADAVDCDFVYALLPRSGSLQTMIAKQALARAKNSILPVTHSMQLESQGPKSGPGPNVRALARKLAERPGRGLWKK
jgi:predicted DNA-binding mobile mystery protein A